MQEKTVYEIFSQLREEGWLEWLIAAGKISPLVLEQMDWYEYYLTQPQGRYAGAISATALRFSTERNTIDVRSVQRCVKEMRRTVGIRNKPIGNTEEDSAGGTV